MNKKIIISIVVIIVLVIAFFAFGLKFTYKSNVSKLEFNTPNCKLAEDIAGFKFAFSGQNNNLHTYHYATNGINGGTGFDFSYKDFENQKLVNDFFVSSKKEFSDFSAKYPDNSKVKDCTIGDVAGLCGVYSGRLDLFAWLDGNTYKVLNNFYFEETEVPSDKFVSIVRSFNACKIVVQ